MNAVKAYLSDFINLLYPITCAACGKNLTKGETIICTECLYYLPKTNYHKEKENPVSRIFWGRVYIENATAFFFFHKGSPFQELLHKLKYNGRKEIGSELGSYLGAELKHAELYNDIDMIVPVPLHPKRQKKRGYNQSEWIALGIAGQMKIPVDTVSLYRSVATETQTKKGRDERWNNVENIFKIRQANEICNKHILLVDDVVTTGSTLEACARALLAVEGVRVSVACLAYSSL
jgi:competence protein ComFC